MAVRRGAMELVVVVINARAARGRCILLASFRRWRYCCCVVAALFCCVFASMALSVRRSVLRREVALPCCTSSGACLWLWAVLVHSSQRDMSKTSASAFFVLSLRELTLVLCCARSRVELAACKDTSTSNRFSLRYSSSPLSCGRGHASDVWLKAFNIARSRSWASLSSGRYLSHRVFV